LLMCNVPPAPSLTVAIGLVAQTSARYNRLGARLLECRSSRKTMGETDSLNTSRSNPRTFRSRLALLRRHSLVQFLCFGFVGMAATAVHYSVALAISQVTSVFLANVIGYSAGILTSYSGHYRFTFIDARGRHINRFPRFVLVSLTGLALSQLTLLALIKFVTLPDWQALLISVIVLPPLTFLLNRQWVFRSQEAS
jgi:putative flippase GtrA